MSKTFRWDGKLQIEFLYFESQRVSCEIQKFVTEHQMLSIKMANFQVSDRTLKEHLDVSDERILILKKGECNFKFELWLERTESCQVL